MQKPGGLRKAERRKQTAALNFSRGGNGLFFIYVCKYTGIAIYLCVYKAPT